ncbi:MAG: hypothetical protein ABR555_11575 [Pyrinomonadaceae bacterium]
MKFRIPKVSCGLLLVFLIAALGSTAEIQKQPDCGKNTPWFNPGKNCLFKPKPYHYYARNIYIDREQRGCEEVLLVCNAKFVRQSTVARDPGCPEAFWPDPKDGDEVCCEEFEKAVKSKQPCDPSKDADCDGIPNENDSDPFRTSEPANSPSQLKCYQLQLDVEKAYLTAGADKSAVPMSRNARYDCLMRIEKEKCPSIPWEPPNDYHGPVKYPKDPDPDHKCAQLGQDVYQAYLKAGAKDDTATYAGEAAKEYCRKQRASKLPS